MTLQDSLHPALVDALVDRSAPRAPLPFAQLPLPLRAPDGRPLLVSDTPAPSAAATAESAERPTHDRAQLSLFTPVAAVGVRATSLAAALGVARRTR